MNHCGTFFLFYKFCNDVSLEQFVESKQRWVGQVAIVVPQVQVQLQCSIFFAAQVFPQSLKYSRKCGVLKNLILINLLLKLYQATIRNHCIKQIIYSQRSVCYSTNAKRSLYWFVCKYLVRLSHHNEWIAWLPRKMNINCFSQQRIAAVWKSKKASTIFDH